MVEARVHGAEVPDQDGVRRPLGPARGYFPRLSYPWVDAGYRGRGKERTEEQLGVEVEVANRIAKASPKKVLRIRAREWFKEGRSMDLKELAKRPAFEDLPCRRVAGRASARIGHNRRTAKDHERPCSTGGAFVRAAMARPTVGRSARAKTFPRSGYHVREQASRGGGVSVGREGLLKRLRYLRDYELLGGAVLAGALCWLWAASGGEVGWAVRLSSLFPLCYVLLQGSFYWHLKLRSLERRTPLPAWFGGLFRLFERSNALALGLPLVALAAALYADRASAADAAWTAGVLAFAALEHVNYYAWQLTHDTANDVAYLRRHRKLRRASLAEDLRRAPATTNG